MDVLGHGIQGGEMASLKTRRPKGHLSNKPMTKVTRCCKDPEGFGPVPPCPTHNLR